MKSIEIRTKFFDFFIKRSHEKVASSSLIPAQDPTLLFANAGMNQFKDVFLGKEKRSYTRAVSIQKCVRAGGKHNDLDNVGFTKRHLTFFEMMGNFSFGDYFKKDAIEFAWDFLTKELKLPTEHMHATVYKDDDESYNLWRDVIGLPENKIHRLGAKDNFWQMGDTGPCGPCSEIHIDRGPDWGCKELCGPACDCDRFLEIWNLVFMQYDRQPDGSDKLLKQTGVDTGMGLERLCSVVQNVDSVYQTDLFTPIIQRIEDLTGKIYAQQDSLTRAAFHVLADHIRSTSFLIADGCAPSNEGRGYVLRKIIRRAALFTQKLTDASIFPELSKVVVEEMSPISPELKTNQAIIFSILTSEVEKFAANLIRGQHILRDYFKENAATKRINGNQAFKLYDTYGFPLELIKLMADEQGFSVDIQGFEQEMARQKEQSGKKSEDMLDHIKELENVTTEFTGYQELETPSKITALVCGHNVVQKVPAGMECYVITEKSPFFIVGGGQVPDQGWLMIQRYKIPLISVRYINNAIAAHIKAPIDLEVGIPVTSIVNKELRVNAMKNHTATHMLQAALIEVLGNTIKQSGSLVHPDYLRFDFTYHENLSAETVKKVEDIVNAKIEEDIPVSIEYMPMNEAIKRGALAFFGDKYNPEQVRMVNIPHFSVELCGGTHVHRTGEIGVFKITEVSALSAGHRRLVAVTGPRAVELFQDTFNTVKQLAQDFKVKRDELIQAIGKQKESIKELQQQIKQLKKQAWKSQIPAWINAVELINGISFLFLHLNDMSAEELREMVTELLSKKPAFYFAISNSEGKYIFVCMIPSTMTEQLNLKEFGSWLKTTQQLSGGGNQTSLQGGGVNVNEKQLEDAIKNWLKER